MSFHLTHVTYEFHQPKTISEHIACLVETVHLSCVLMNIISKETEMSFHLTHVTREFH
jgi:hypothetical protein